MELKRKHHSSRISSFPVANPSVIRHFIRVSRCRPRLFLSFSIDADQSPGEITATLSARSRDGKSWIKEAAQISSELSFSLSLSFSSSAVALRANLLPSLQEKKSGELDLSMFWCDVALPPTYFFFLFHMRASFFLFSHWCRRLIRLSTLVWS